MWEIAAQHQQLQLEPETKRIQRRIGLGARRPRSRAASDVCRPQPVSDAARDLDGERRGRSGVGSAWSRVSAEAVDAERLSPTSHRLRVVWLARAAGRVLAGGRGCRLCDECLGQPGTFAVEMESLTAIEQMLAQPLGEPRPGLRATRDALRVLERTYEYHGGFRCAHCAHDGAVAGPLLIASRLRWPRSPSRTMIAPSRPTGRSRAARSCSRTTPRSARAPRIPRPSCACSARSRGAPATSSRRSVPTTAATARTRSGSSSSTSTR